MNRALTALFITLFTLPFLAQNGTVKGFVYEKSTGEVLPFANVFLKGTTLGVSTDLNGFFSIGRVPPGNYVLMVTSLEFDTISEKITIKAGEILTKKLFANKGGLSLQEVDVSTTSTEKIENTSVAIQKIDPIVINKLPSVGEPDLAQYLQVLPGVVFTGDQGGQLYIRGGLPVQNKVLLDGLIVYNPFHSIGLFSVFDAEIMKNADVYSAGFGAEYGGRTSSIMDITTRDGNKKRVAGKVSASTFGLKTVLEGPLRKMKEDGGGSSSFIISAKHSYLPQTSKLLYSYANAEGLPFYYTDVYAKASINAAGGSKISAFGFSFNDKVDYAGIASFAWKNNGIGTNFVIVPPSSNLLMEGSMALSNYSINYSNPNLESDNKSSSISSFNAGFNFVKFFGKQELRYGFETVYTGTKYQVQNPYYAFVTINRTTTDVAAYTKYKFLGRKKAFVFEPSFRLQYYASLNILSPEPRAAVKLNLSKKIRFKGAAGLYSQTLFSASNDRDIVNLFYGFINGPESFNFSTDYLTANGGTAQASSSVQKASHIVAGVELDVLKYIDLNIEVYQKFFNQILNTNRNKIYEDNTSNSFRSDALKKNFVVEQGRARGFDVTLKYDRKRFYFWAVYSLTFNQRWLTSGDSLVAYPPNLDRRHNVNLVFSYSLGKKKNWEINARWNFGSGFPFTQTQGYINTLNPSGSVTYNFNTGNGPLNYIPAALNQGRLPSYHRLDIGVKYKYKINERSNLEVNAGATNLYNRDNIFYVDRFTFKRFNQLPIMPSVNLTLGF